MKRLGLLFALALLVGCGGSSGSSSPTIDGNWSGVLRYSDGTTSFFAFTTSLKQSSTSAVTVMRRRVTCGRYGGIRRGLQEQLIIWNEHFHRAAKPTRHHANW